MPFRLARLFAISFGLLLLTVPWWSWDRGGPVWGFPRWAFYSFLATVGYAVIHAVLIGRYWDRAAGDDDVE